MEPDSTCITSLTLLCNLVHCAVLQRRSCMNSWLPTRFSYFFVFSSFYSLKAQYTLWKINCFLRSLSLAVDSFGSKFIIFSTNVALVRGLIQKLSRRMPAQAARTSICASLGSIISLSPRYPMYLAPSGLSFGSRTNMWLLRRSIIPSY